MTVPFHGWVKAVELREHCPHCSASDCWHDCTDCECPDREDYAG